MVKNNRIKDIILFARNPQLWICICLAAFFWALNRLGNTYTSDVVIPITITGVGDNDKIIDESNINVHSTVRANGYTVSYLRLSEYFNRYKFTVADIDMKRSADSLYFELPASSLESALRKKFGAYIDMLTVNDHHLTVGAKRYRQKTLSVIADYDIDLGGELMQVGQILLEPCSVIVGGTSSLIDTLSNVHTEKFKISSQRDNFDGEVHLITHPTLVYSQNTVRYSVNTEQYTELEREYDVVVKTASDSVLNNMFVLPEKVLVTFNITKNAYVKFKPGDISVFVEYDFKEKDNRYLVRYNTVSDNISVIGVEPRFVTVLNDK